MTNVAVAAAAVVVAVVVVATAAVVATCLALATTIEKVAGVDFVTATPALRPCLAVYEWLALASTHNSQPTTLPLPTPLQPTSQFRDKHLKPPHAAHFSNIFAQSFISSSILLYPAGSRVATL